MGVEPSQQEMVALPSSLDNYLKCQLSIHGMEHYMDDYNLKLPTKRQSFPLLAGAVVVYHAWPV